MPTSVRPRWVAPTLTWAVALVVALVAAVALNAAHSAKHSYAYNSGVTDAAQAHNTDSQSCFTSADNLYSGSDTEARDQHFQYWQGCRDWTLAHGGH